MSGEGMTDDTIYRQAAIDIICKEGTRLERNGTVAMAEIKQWCVGLIESLPSAQPKREKGKWLWELADNGWANHICSKCGWTKNTDIHVSLGYNFCPNCGAEMSE